MDATNRNTALASAFVEELARCGMRRAAISPGSRSTPLALALWRHPAVETTVHVDERCAGFFALGAAQAKGVPVAVLCTSGTAAANLHPAVAEASESAVPLVVLTADRPPELRGIGAGQTIDQMKLFGGAVRWFCEVGTHQADDPGLIHMRSVACRAYAAARGEPRPGPVHLNLAWREPLAPVAVESDVTATSEPALRGRGERPLTAVASAPPPPAAPLVEEIAERIARTPRGLIVVGRQTDPTLAAPVAELARAAGYPILAEPTSQLRMGAHDQEFVVWAYDAIARARSESLAPELIVRFGEFPTSKALRQWLGGADEVRQVVVDPLWGWNEPTRLAETVVRADAVAVARGLVGVLDADRGAHPSSAFLDAWLGAGQAAGGAILEGLAGLEGLTEPGIHGALGGVYPDGSLVYTASSMPIRDQEAFLPSGSADVRFLANRGANGIDGLISSGLGAAAATGRPTFIVTGDLGLYHDMNGLLALRDLTIDARILVIDNGGGGIFDFLPQAKMVPEMEALFTTPVGIDLARVAALYDLEHRRVTSTADLAEALVAPRVLVEAPTDRATNVELHRTLAAEAQEAVAANVPG